MAKNKELAKYLADYVSTEVERSMEIEGFGAWDAGDMEEWIKAGLEAYESINDTTPENAKLYHITYREEFLCTVRAVSEEDAIDKARASTEWELITGDIWLDYAVCELAEETPAIDKRIRTIEQLKELAADPDGLDCYILLNGGLHSSKQLWFYPDDKTFHVLNLIDGSEQNLTEEEILSPASSNFAEAMLKGALISER